MIGKLRNSWFCWVWFLILMCLHPRETLDLGWGGNWGYFLVNIFFCLLINSPLDPIFEPHKFIWKVGIPPKVKVFASLASWKRVNTCALL